MKIQVLLATMFFENEDETYLRDMNIETDLVVGNQCDTTKDESFTFNGHTVTVLSRKERGVGKNRNLALFHSDADIVVFADNDIHYRKGYKALIEEFYTAHPEAEMVIFNIREIREDGFLDQNLKDKRAKFKDITKFGTDTITARRESLLKHRISFSLLFGGGAKYGCGEDSLFLRDCYRKGMKIYLCSKTLADLKSRESTWFHGITSKYVYDKGVLFGAMCPRLYRFAILYHAFKHRKTYAEFGSMKEVVRLMRKGADEYRSQKRL